MRAWSWFLVVLLSVLGVSCSGGSNDNPDSSTCERSCATSDECPRDSYCDQSCCKPGCATDADCEPETCNTETHQCTGAGDGGPDGGGDGGDAAGDPGGGDQGGDAATDNDCPQTHDKVLGQECECDGQCVPESPYCFADILNDTGPLYCTIRDCTTQPDN